MDELIDILNSEGNYTGQTALKSEAHLNGLFHQTIHVWFYTEHGEVLLQQRGKNKSTYPLKWDVSVAGHIGASESFELGAIREVEEEIGVSITSEQLDKIGVFKTEKRHSQAFFDREFNHTFLCLLDKKLTLIKQESEVEDLKWLSLNEFEGWVQEEHPDLVPNSENRYQFIISEIKSRL
ncbi:NUDIX hydrolase [Croceitalea rosinachiae]|uniref:NUDIX domain-containing protein n=1 Tax=Croceitalea rosinachiae TaxID=3075596 RepID=A0ABU3AAN8_9FLAO|nr:NUDIX domain-containing protein [Croceitalea sp. F388]MDT0607234.1 NUDIX domain-containing protein [Croceitalea sp. F388]